MAGTNVATKGMSEEGSGLIWAKDLCLASPVCVIQYLWRPELCVCEAVELNINHGNASVLPGRAMAAGETQGAPGATEPHSLL